MKQPRATRAISLTLKEWATLEELATEFSCRSHTGIQARQATWMALFRDVARRRLGLVDNEPNVHLERLDRALAQLAKQKEQEDQSSYHQLSMLEPSP